MYQRAIQTLVVYSGALLLAASPASVLWGAKKPVNSKKGLARLSPEKRQRLERKLEHLREEQQDQPEEAAVFRANMSTGPVTYRGANPTTSRPLNTALYQPAIQQIKNMPRFSAGTNSILPADGGQSLVVNVASPGAALGTWTSLGPTNQGGRTRAILIDPGNPNLMFAGGVDGGVWKSTDAGATWTTNTDLALTNLAVVTLAFQPNNTNIIYAGTGEGVGNVDAIRGAGIFKSTDGGATWNQLPSTNNSSFYYSMKVVVSPRNPQRVWAATRAGLFRSLDGGGSFTSVISAGGVGGCTDMALQVNRSVGYLFVSCGRLSAQGTVYRLLDSDTSTATSVLSLTGQSRSAIAIAPSNENYVYIMASQGTAGAGAGQYGLHGIYRSTANGNPGSFTTQRAGNVAPADTATKINQLLLSNPVIALLTECSFGTSSFSNQGWYDNVLAVDPLDANKVWAGGIDLWRSDDGGVNWGVATYWWFDKGVDPQYGHADHHAIVFHPAFNGTSNKIMYIGSDGGIERTNDARAAVGTTLTNLCGTPVAQSTSWVDASNGYITTQFYDGTAYPDGNTYFGGLQDNGTLRGAIGNTNFAVLKGGDGGYTALDTKGDANAGNDVLFLENTGLSLQKSVDGGANFSSATSGITGASGFQFITPFAMNLGDKQQLWIGGYDIWRTTNQAASWTRATGVNQTCGAGAVSAIATHPLDGNRVLVGMSDGCYHYNFSALSAPNTGTWPGGSTIASGAISWIAWDPTDINIAYATVSNFTATTLLKTTNGGQTWSASMGSGATALPQIPARTVVVNPASHNQVFVGTDLGVYTSIDGGASWYREVTGFANVSVDSLKINETAPYKLFAFTHGRGVWMTTLADSGVGQGVGTTSK